MLLDGISQHEVINIAYGERTTLNQLWQSIAAYTNNHKAPVYREERRGDVKHSLADISKAKQLIGYEPEISIDKGLQLSISWYEQALEAQSKQVMAG